MARNLFTKESRSNIHPQSQNPLAVWLWARYSLLREVQI